MSDSKSGGVGCFGIFIPVLTAIFVGLKLAELGAIASWSWWWVFSPIWISIGLVIAIICGFLAVVAFLKAVLDK
jgi:hypothetical protein